MPQIGNLMVSVYREESKHTGELTSAFCKAQQEFTPVVLDCEGRRGGESYRYGSIASIRRSTQSALAKHGLMCHHVYGSNDEGSYVVTVLRHTSGEYITSTLRIPHRDDVQEQKAAMTLLCRTALEGLLGVVAEEDDDGASVSSAAVDPEQAKRWASTLALALDSIAKAKDEAEVIKYRLIAFKRSQTGMLAPDAMQAITTACEDRMSQLTKEVSSVGSQTTAGTKGPNAAGSGGGSSNRQSGGRAAGTGRGHVPAGDRLAPTPA